MPPDWMLPFDEELAVWFDRVIEARNEKYGSDDDDDDEGESSMMQNEYAKQGR